MNDRDQVSHGDILIVDDTPANLRLLSQMLSEDGYNVRAVTSGARALDSINIARPHLILLDIKMPDMDGYEVCEQLKADEKTSHIPVIFISALDDIDAKIRAFQSGGVDYITKPFQLEEVLARTKTHLEMQNLQKRLREANRKFEWELQLAGRVQTNFLPTEIPNIAGYEIAMKLKPARETSGDFFDIFPLAEGKFSFTVADVVDKGVGAALFMVYSWSLMRTYTSELYQNPSEVMRRVNQRIMVDTIGDQFVTVFFSVLDPPSGIFRYSNAGHTPPIHWTSNNNNHVNELKATGTVLGLFEDHSWEQAEIKIEPGDILVLYSDGIPDAQNEQGLFFDQERLFDSIGRRVTESANNICEGVLADVADHIGNALQVDDIVIMVIVRR